MICEVISSISPVDIAGIIIAIISAGASIYAIKSSTNAYVRSTLSQHLLNKAQEANTFVSHHYADGFNTTFGISSIASSIITAKQIIEEVIKHDDLSESKKEQMKNIYYLSLHMHIRVHLWKEDCLKRITNSNLREDQKTTIRNQLNDSRYFLKGQHQNFDIDLH